MTQTAVSLLSRPLDDVLCETAIHAAQRRAPRVGWSAREACGHVRV